MGQLQILFELYAGVVSFIIYEDDFLMLWMLEYIPKRKKNINIQRSIWWGGMRLQENIHKVYKELKNALKNQYEKFNESVWLKGYSSHERTFVEMGRLIYRPSSTKSSA